jgi:hypothetical protein
MKQANKKECRDSFAACFQDNAPAFPRLTASERKREKHYAKEYRKLGFHVVMIGGRAQLCYGVSGTGTRT